MDGMEGEKPFQVLYFW